MLKSDELRQERYKLVKQAREVLDAAEKEKRDLTAEEEHKYEEIMADVDAYEGKIENAEKGEQRRKRIEEFGDDDFRPQPEQEERRVGRDSEEYRKAFAGYLGSTEAPTAAAFQSRALQMDSATSGGYTVAPQQFVANLIEAVRNMTVVRGLATVYSVPTAQSLGAPALDNRPTDPTWTSEILTGSEDSTMSFGKRELYPHPLAQLLKVSKKLVRASAINIEQVIRDQMSYKISVVEENAFLNGSGANQPLGVFTAGADAGISTSRDVSTGNTTTEILGDNLIECKYTLKSAYWSRARWIFHRDAVKQIRKLKDGEGQYLWRPGLQGDRGDTILDVPVLMSEYAPNTFTTGQYVGIIGDFSRYWIADALDMTIQVLTELYAATNQNGYISRKETDGMPVLEEAFVRVTLA
jgi:HK97 family phage major capsid protein